MRRRLREIRWRLWLVLVAGTILLSGCDFFADTFGRGTSVEGVVVDAGNRRDALS